MWNLAIDRKNVQEYLWAISYLTALFFVLSSPCAGVIHRSAWACSMVIFLQARGKAEKSMYTSSNSRSKYLPGNTRTIVTAPPAPLTCSELYHNPLLHGCSPQFYNYDTVIRSKSIEYYYCFIGYVNDSGVSPLHRSFALTTVECYHYNDLLH
jgi:hypothetical protein